MQTIKDRTIQIDGVKVGYGEIGSGEPLVLIHGDKYFWSTFFKALASNGHFRLITVSPPGYGGLKSAEKINTLKKFCSILDQFFAKLNLDSVNLVGQSLGSIIALLYASQHPEKIKRLLLLSPPFAMMARKRTKALEKFLSLSLKHDPLYQLNSKLHKTRFVNYWAVKVGGLYQFDWEIFEKIIMPAAKECNERPAIANTASLCKINHLPLLEKLKCPTAVIIGDHDPVIPVGEAKKICHNFPNLKLFIIPRAKHAIMIEKPKELTEVMIDYLKQSAV